MFDLGYQADSYESGSSLSYSSGALTVDITGAKVWFPSSVGAEVSKDSDTTVSRQNGYGLWVGDHLIDGNGSYANDLAIFTFSQAVSLASFKISYADAHDDFNLNALIGGKLIYLGGGDAASGGSNDAGSLSTVALGGSLLTTSTVFAIGVADNGDEFKIRKLTVHVPEVPLPAGGVLLLTALGGVGAVRRLRRRR